MSEDTKQLDRMEDLLTQLIRNVAGVRAKVDCFEGELANVKNEFADFRAEAAGIREEVTSVRAEVTSLGTQVVSFRTEVNHRFDRLEGHF